MSAMNKNIYGGEWWWHSGMDIFMCHADRIFHPERF